MFSRRFFLSLFLVLIGSFSQASELSFYSYEDAIEVAKSQNKNVYVLFGGDHCPWCHKQKEILLKDSVIESLSDHITCYVDTSEERKVALKYRIRSIPVNMVIDSDENILKKNVGYMDESKFINWIR